MTQERWQQINELLLAAIEHPASQRAAFLDKACASDPDLRREVESLLACQEPAEDFIETPACEMAAWLTNDPDESMVGRHIGPYKVTRKIGYGGMGAVYLAVRADNQFQKRVAIKFVRRGMDTDALLRFRNEQKILANLNHPSIARLIDGGVTADGLSYFIMEYIEGLPIDVYCDTHKLPTVERLQLFRTVCSAVHYAHQHRIVHRDLKPSNILVTAEGVPMLLDFGIAKVLSPDLSYETLGTMATAPRPMTPEYASPEQVCRQAITPASDVYSLGVLLYELLTGHRPYHIKSRALQEIERVIREQEPERPSTVVRRTEEVPSTAGANSQITITPESVSETREGSPERLYRRLAGDLDTIVLTAMRKEPGRRYASVEQFSEDIRRYLEDLPIIARRDTRWYRTAKFIHRNKGRVIEAALLVVIVLMLVGVVLHRAPRREKANADLHSAMVNVHAVDREAYDAYLKGLYHFWTKGAEEDNLKRSIEFFHQALTKDPGYARAYAGLADSYIMLGAFGLLPPKASFPQAQAAAMRALELDDKLAEAHNSLGAVKMLYHWDLWGAEREFQQALELNTRYALAHNWYAQTLAAMGRKEASIAEKKRALELDPLSLMINSSLATAFYYTGQYDEAIEQSRKVIDLSPSFWYGHLNLGRSCEQKGMYEEAITELQKAINLSRGPSTIAMLGHVYAVLGKRQEAHQLIDELKELAQARYISPHSIATIYAGLGEKDQAFEWLCKAYEVRASELIWLKTDPKFYSLRPDRRFADLIRRVGLPP